MTAFTIESWTWYGGAMVMVLARLASRTWHFRSIRKLQTEDFLMGFLAVRARPTFCNEHMYI